MLKKLLASTAVFVIMMTSMVEVDVVNANSTVSQETTSAAAPVVEKQVLFFNDTEESTEKLDFCNNTEAEDVQETINTILTQDIELEQVKEVIDNASNIAQDSEESSKQNENQSTLIYENLDVNADDEILLATIIFCEAGNQSYEGKVAVGNVVLNRVASNEFPNTVKDVIYDYKQFSPVLSGWYDRELAKGTVDESCLQAARDAINGVNIVGEALYFHVNKGGEDGLVVGAHVFY